MIQRLTARTIALLVGVALLLGLIAFALHQWNVARTAKTQSRIDRGQAEAATATASDALSTMGNATAAAQETDKTVQEGRDAIDNADAGNSNDAADRAMCRMRTYYDTERCRQLRSVRAPGVANSGAIR